MPSPALHALAARLGILPAYVDQRGERRITSDDTRVAILAAMGIDASTEDAARDALQALEVRERRRIVPPVRVVPDSEAWESTVQFRVPEEWALPPDGSIEYACELRDERGAVTRHEGRIERTHAGVANIGLAPFIETGYYRMRLTLGVRGAVHEGEQTLIVAPSSCPVPSRRAFGIIANLYSLRSARNWGVGNFGDLAMLAEWSARRGAAFVGVNPLHALRNHGIDISPYGPVSRLYRNPIYLDIEAIPELAASDEARRYLASEPVQRALADLRASDRVAYERIAALQRPLLDALHRAFLATHHGTGDARDRAYARYVEEEGDALTTFAVFRALEEHFTEPGAPHTPWQRWPAPYRTPASPEVAAFREAHREAVGFHKWVQFELDRQLAAAAERGRAAGLTIGLYQDLAIGTGASGSDTWAYPDLFLFDVAVGAPPDDYSASGQNWGLPPISPHRLYETRYAYWIAVLRASLRHGGALRIDHVLGLFRQFWIPAGKTGRDGAYVRFPANDLLGILALEAARHRALIVGEDLGTIPPEVPGTLKRWGILSSRVMMFEREADGTFRPGAQYEPLSLATADTHDMAPLAGFWQGRDIVLRQELGLIETAEELAEAWSARERLRRALLARLVGDGALAGAAEPPPDGAALCGAVHRFLCATPALLVGLSLDDLTGEVEPVNIPGVGADRFPSWTRRMRVPIEELSASADVAAALQCERPADP